MKSRIIETLLDLYHHFVSLQVQAISTDRFISLYLLGKLRVRRFVKREDFAEAVLIELMEMFGRGTRENSQHRKLNRSDSSKFFGFCVFP